MEFARAAAAKAWIFEPAKKITFGPVRSEAFPQILLAEMYAPHLGCPYQKNCSMRTRRGLI